MRRKTFTRHPARRLLAIPQVVYSPTYKQIFSNNIDRFVARSDIVLIVPLDVEYPEIIFRTNIIKEDKRPTYIAGALFLITFVLFLIILVLFILEKRKHQCKVTYS